MKSLEKWVGLAFILGGLSVLFYQLPLGTALEFGKDEGFEVMKAFLCSKGHVLYKEIWNDQPPVHTMLLTACFKMWGPTILTARVLAAGFGLVLFAAFYELVRMRSSIWCALISCFLLLASPLVLLLNVSVMLEVPAIGTALLAALLMFRWREKGHAGWLVASGCVMGIALQIKLTAALVAPAILMEIALQEWMKREGDWPRRVVGRFLWWGVPVLILFLAIGFTWGRGSFESSIKSHLTQETAAPGMAAGPGSYPIEWRLFAHHVECLVAAVVGVVWAIRRKRWMEVSFPTVLLGTLIVVHGLHRPWWNYYYLHFAVPVAWLAGWAAHEALNLAISYLRAKGLALAPQTTWKAMALCLVCAAILARSESRLESNFKQVRDSPKTNASALLAKMRRYGPGTHWVCAEDVIYPFHAQLKVPPELAVIMSKRFWSGQISSERIVEVCRKYGAEQIMLPNGGPAGSWSEFLHSQYGLEFADKEFVLYVRNDLLKGGQ